MSQRSHLLVVVLGLLIAGGAQAQEIEITPDEGTPVEIEPDITPTSEPTTEEPTIDIPADEVPKAAPKGIEGPEKQSWRDVVTVVRKPFLKASRIELVPALGVTLNDNMIRHIQFDVEANYHLSHALSVGVEGQYYVKNLLDPYEMVAVQYRRLPTLNKYNFGGAVNFHYVPVYAKFAMLNKYIVHWEAAATVGVGFLQSEVMPRDPAMEGWTNFLISPNLGLNLRVFVNRGMTINIGVKDYIFADKFEAPNRTRDDSLEYAQDHASSLLINHIVFQAGISFWIPPTFSYTTFR